MFPEDAVNLPQLLKCSFGQIIRLGWMIMQHLAFLYQSINILFYTSFLSPPFFFLFCVCISFVYSRSSTVQLPLTTLARYVILTLVSKSKLFFVDASYATCIHLYTMLFNRTIYTHLTVASLVSKIQITILVIPFQSNKD